MRYKPLFLTLAAAALIAACSDKASDPAAPPAAATNNNNVPDNGGKVLTVMTRNLYLGASLDPVFGAPSPQVIPVRVAGIWAQVQQTNFPERAKALADEIVQAQADLVGLQEVSLWRTQFPGDAHLPNSVPATEVVYDFLQILMDELAARGQHYDVVSAQNGVDAELFMFTGTPGASLTRDIRMTDRDVIIAKHEITVSNARGGTYNASFAFNVGGAGGPAITIPRAWVSVDAKYRGETFRFFSTHLEQDVMPFAPIQEAQGNEVISLLASSPYPVIALGDYNTGDGAATATYGNLIASGLTDVWREVNFENSGFTTEGIGPDLLGAFTLSKRLDLIMYHGNMRGLQAWLVGDQEGNRTPSGLMPSDHAGVVARIRIGVR